MSTLQIREQGKVRVLFPRESDADKETIHLVGDKENVSRAKAELETIIKQLNETVEIKVGSVFALLYFGITN